MDESSRRLMDVFINSAYGYGDKIALYYNIKGGKQVSYINNCDALEDVEGEDISGLSDVRISNDTPLKSPK